MKKADNFKKIFTLHAEIDYLVFLLQQMLKTEKGLSPIARMIDKSTGFDKEKLKKANIIMAQITRRKKKYEELCNGRS